MSSTLPPPAANEVRRAPQPPSSRADDLTIWRMIGIALLAGLAVFLIGAALDWRFVHGRESRVLTIGISDTLAALVAAGLVFRILQYERERRRRMRQRLEVIAEMNHHIRNALHVISLSAASSSDQVQLQAIRESMQRIQWALRELLPKV